MSVSCLLGLINLGSSVALNDVLSMSVSGVYSSYLIVGVLLLWRRCRGDIALHSDTDDMAINVPGAKLVWGPFRVPGVWGILVNAYAVLYKIIIIFFSYWPPMLNPGIEYMNFSVVGTVGTVILAIAYYVLRARYTYDGPVLETSL